MRPAYADIIGDIEYWRKLNLHLTISAERRFDPQDRISVTTEQMDDLAERVWNDGYFQLEPKLGEQELTDLRRAVERLVGEEVSPIFAFVYDEFWQVFHRLHPLLGRILGPDYRTLPNFWAWCVGPNAAGAGWSPHRDNAQDAVLAEGRLRTLTIWIPLTDATPENGCIYIVPQGTDPAFDESRIRSWMLPSIRALPAAAGSIMGWRQDLYHWGGRSSARAEEPRVSLSFEFQDGASPIVSSPPLMLDHLPDYPTRIRLILWQCQKYAEHEPQMSPELLELSQRWSIAGRSLASR